MLTFYGFAQIQADFAEDCLKKHNEYRKKHSAPDLTLDQELSNGAESYAKELAEKDVFEHSKAPGLGENLYLTYGGDPNDCVKEWYDEISLYDFKKPGFAMNTGHFTQVVWKSTTKLGMGKAASKGGKIYVVGRYQPQGNILGKFEQNVLKSNNGVTHSVSYGFIALAAAWLRIEFIV
ncbi:Golgi-associated plant pathogenesis-related protein 1 isoform X2 [Drosophila obscura]|uniref:Golgi-associated plant pathogenesis-related protein 1 isoform X2 n=1 Tax=Drosophila obscura TaxID=7282 RepID=UPI001BB174C1|nr:Golgi-associated plant pathogenesis-related protein 1 isoform X2 [Drosophila obscura]